MRNRHRLHRVYAWLVLILISLAFVTYAWPVPKLKPTAKALPVESTKTVNLDWPDAPEAAIGAVGFGILDQNGIQSPRPIASTAKLITALTVLKKYPLTSNGSGPTITLTAADVALYNKYVATSGSVVPVAAGEQITERQVLEAMMLPSANNMADSLATWAFGSLSAYKTAATKLVASLGMTQTTIGSDASGFSPDTTSMARDLEILGQAALANPALAGIVNEKQAVLPLAGSIQNVNWLLGEDGIVGIKTGNTDQAGGVYVFAAKDELDASHAVTIVGSIVGSNDLQNAIDSAVPLINSVKQGFVLSQVATAGQVVGHYKVPWLDQSVAAVLAQNAEAVVWLGAPAQPVVGMVSIKAPQTTRAVTGQVSIKPTGSIGKVVFKQAIPSPPWWWRLTRHRF